MNPVKSVIWYTFPLQTVGGGERLLLEGLKWFTSNGVKSYLFANGEGVDKEALFDESYDPAILKFDRPSYSRLGKFGLLFDTFHKVHFLKKQSPDAVIANSPIEAVKLFLYNLFVFNKINYSCFIHGSYFQFPEDIEKYAWVYKKSFDEIWGNDEVYKKLIPRKSPKIGLKRRVKNEIVNYLKVQAVRRAKSVFVLTKKQKKEIKQLFNHKNVVTCHGAFSKEIFNYKLKENKKKKWGLEEKNVIFSMCRLVRKKQVNLIIDGFALYQKENPNAFLLIGGKGPEMENLITQAKKLNVEGGIRFLGYVPDYELHDYYCSCDVFVTADNADYDITTFVALAMGNKVVASAQHEFEPQLKELGQLFHAEPNKEGFANAYAESIDAVSQPNPSKEKLLDSYSWERYFHTVWNNL